jgi:hypothetical protein
MHDWMLVDLKDTDIMLRISVPRRRSIIASRLTLPVTARNIHRGMRALTVSLPPDAAVSNPLGSAATMDPTNHSLGADKPQHAAHSVAQHAWTPAASPASIPVMAALSQCAESQCADDSSSNSNLSQPPSLSRTCGGFQDLAIIFGS